MLSFYFRVLHDELQAVAGISLQCPSKLVPWTTATSHYTLISEDEGEQDVRRKGEKACQEAESLESSCGIAASNDQKP